MKYRRTTLEAVLLLLSIAAVGLATYIPYDWRWGGPVNQYEDVVSPYVDVKLTDRNSSRAADVWSEWGSRGRPDFQTEWCQGLCR